MFDSEIRARLTLTRRDQESLVLCSKSLEKLGFKIAVATTRGVVFSGKMELFESAFGAQLVIDDDIRFASEPVIPYSLTGIVKSLYFPTTPTLF